jgi:hypothetical protein
MISNVFKALFQTLLTKKAQLGMNLGGGRRGLVKRWNSLNVRSKLIKVRLPILIHLQNELEACSELKLEL